MGINCHSCTTLPHDSIGLIHSNGIFRLIHASPLDLSNDRAQVMASELQNLRSYWINTLKPTFHCLILLFHWIDPMNAHVLGMNLNAT